MMAEESVILSAIIWGNSAYLPYETGNSTD